ncbi:MAG TPA: DUF1992 domain-containing protein [Pseudonocardiaceae bacterium]|nr:DUF1992 domain-containing protein [Pseudonocardiaceae bacterium]
MTSRWESVIDKQIREAQERGEFDNLPGAGKPLAGLDQPYDENWWVKALLRRESLADPAPLRAEVDRLLERVSRLTLESSVRDIVADLNTRLRNAGESATVDADAVVRAWRERRTETR